MDWEEELWAHFDQQKAPVVSMKLSLGGVLNALT
jgi:hypothetical protein